MMDMTVMALACDLTAVGFLQWADSEAKYTCPWLNLPETHYFYQNGGGYRPAELERIYTWYSSQHAYLLQQLAGVDLGGQSLLDETVVFFGTELQHPATHAKKNMPFLLAGGGCGGRWVTAPADPPTTTCWCRSSTCSEMPAPPSATRAVARPAAEPGLSRKDATR